MGTLLISCGLHSKKSTTHLITPGPVLNHVKQNVPLSTGVNFRTRELVGLNPLTGRLLKPCKDTSDYVGSDTTDYVADRVDKTIPKYRDTKDGECKVKVVAPTNGPLDTALKISKSVIKGTVIRDGKEIPSYSIVEVRTFYKGSDCSSSTAGGIILQNCTDACSVFPGFC